MNEKAFYSAITATMMVVLLATMLFVQQSIATATRENHYQRTIFELETTMQNMQYLLDKATADAMIDSTDMENCGVSMADDEVEEKIQEYIGNMAGIAEEILGMNCNATLPDDKFTYDAGTKTGTSNFSFPLNCKTKESEEFKAEATRTIAFNKQLLLQEVSQGAGLPDKCEAQVKDLQSGTCDALANKTTCD